jgi:hypothetical protein
VKLPRGIMIIHVVLLLARLTKGMVAILNIRIFENDNVIGEGEFDVEWRWQQGKFFNVDPIQFETKHEGYITAFECANTGRIEIEPLRFEADEYVGFETGMITVGFGL